MMPIHQRVLLRGTKSKSLTANGEKLTIMSEKCQKCGMLKCSCSMRKSDLPPPQQSFVIASWAKLHHNPGQVPSHAIRELERLVTDRPRPMAMQLLDHTGPVLSTAKIVENLGMNVQQELQWKRFLEDSVVAAPNEVVLRQSLFQKFQADRVDPELRNAIFQRSLNYVRQTLHKSVMVYTPDELKKSERFYILVEE